MIKFNIATINCCTEIEGPHKRLSIWFQGCNLNCKGCCNPDYRPMIVRNLLTLEELVEIIADAKQRFDIEGVTYLGGEPTLQKGLAELTRSVHNLGLGVIAFTGHQYERVQDDLMGCDMVIDGHFDEQKYDYQRKIIGSTNQRIICLTDRYESCVDWFLNPECKSVEINVSNDIILNGDYI